MVDFVVTTSNIRFDNPEDGANRWELRKKLLAETLLEQRPDIIATQEGRQKQLKELAALLPEYQLVDRHREWIEDRMYPCFFLRRSQFKILDCGDKWLSEEPDRPGSKSFGSLFPRLLTWLRIKTERGPLLLINAHLDHVTDHTREQQAEVLTAQVRCLREGPCILVGDYNAAPNSAVRAIITREIDGIVDPWHTFKHAECNSHHGFGNVTTGTRIDWVLLHQDLTPRSITMDRRCKAIGDQRLFPSDHYPVTCKFSW